MKLKPRKFYDLTYDVEVHILNGVSPKQFRNYVRKVDNPKYKNPGNFTAICRVTNSDIIIGFRRRWRGTPFDYGTLSHEVFHATSKLLFRRDIKLCKHTEECYAYFNGCLFERCVRALK